MGGKSDVAAVAPPRTKLDPRSIAACKGDKEASVVAAPEPRRSKLDPLAVVAVPVVVETRRDFPQLPLVVLRHIVEAAAN